mgnify:CR=1 FL=1
MMLLRPAVLLAGITLGILLGGTGCSHRAPDPHSGGSGLNSPSSVQIDYILGHDHHRFEAQRKDNLVRAITSMDQQTLTEGKIDPQQYSQFFIKALEFVHSVPVKATPTLPCRSPYKMTVTLDGKAHTAQGCRSSDNGSFSKLVKEGELLLLYSKN